MNPRTAVAAAALLSVLALGGCASSSGSSGTGGTAVAPGGGSPSPTVPASAPPSTPPASPSAAPAAAGGACSLIDQAAATQVLGADPGAGKSSGGLGEKDGITKVDGCTYEAAGSHLGYDVLIIKGVPPTAMLSRAASKLKAAAAAGGAKEFSTGLDQSVGYTFHLGSGVDSQIAVISGDNWVTVAVSRKDGDATKTKAAVIAAAQALVSSL